MEPITIAFILILAAVVYVWWATVKSERNCTAIANVLSLAVTTFKGELDKMNAQIRHLEEQIKELKSKGDE